MIWGSLNNQSGCEILWSWIYVAADTHETPSPLSEKSLMLEEKVSWEENSAWCLGAWGHMQEMMFAWMTQMWHLWIFNLLASIHLVQLLAESRKSSECSHGPSKSWGNATKKQPWCAGVPGSGSTPYLALGSPWNMGGVGGWGSSGLVAVRRGRAAACSWLTADVKKSLLWSWLVG